MSWIILLWATFTFINSCMNSKILFAILLVVLIVPPLASAQTIHVTGNRFVWAEVEDLSGRIYFGAGPVTNRTLGGPSYMLSYTDHSYLAIQVDRNIYTNASPNYGGSLGISLVDSGKFMLIADTIVTTWHHTDFDIVQMVYPVEFGISGTIVMRVRVMNHTGFPITAQAQYLLNDAVAGDGGFGSGQNPTTSSLTRLQRGNKPAYGWTWIQYPNFTQTSVPPYILATASTGGWSPFPGPVLGMCYLRDEAAPAPLGLIPVDTVTIGDWLNMIGKWGTPAAVFLQGRAYSDEAFMLQWPAVTIYGSKTTEVASTAFGTPEAQVCTTGKPGGGTNITLYPHVIQDINGKASPSVIPFESILFTDSVTNAQATLNVSGSQKITGPLPVSGNGNAQIQQLGNNGTVTSSPVFAMWTDSIFATSDTTINCELNLTTSALPGGSLCDLPLTIQGFPGNSITRSFHVLRDSLACNSTCSNNWVEDTAIRDSSKLSVILRYSNNMELNMNRPRPDSIQWEVCVVNQWFDGSAIVEVKTPTDSIQEQYQFCTIRDTLAPRIEVHAKYDTAVGVVIFFYEDREWDRKLDTVYITKLTNLRVDASSASSDSGQTSVWYSLVPDGNGTPGTVCLTAIDLAGNRRDTCIAYPSSSDVVMVAPHLSSLSVYPNPFSEVVTIGVDSPMRGEAEILDVLGRVVDRLSFNGSSEWSGSKLLPGTYIVRFTAEGETMSKRIIKE